jgi:hypothetical protein
MNDDYLWDRTGEPDAEIQELEEILGTLRYQPKPLVLPAQLPSVQKRRHFSYLAIAAAIALMLFGAGFWILLISRRPVESVSVRPIPTPAGTTPVPTPSLTTVPENKQAIKSSENHKRTTLPQSRMTHATIVARNASRSRMQTIKRSEAIARERTEAEAAKEQLFLALRVASTTLSLVQKRVQGTYPANMIRNQHRVG